MTHTPNASAPHSNKTNSYRWREKKAHSFTFTFRLNSVVRTMKCEHENGVWRILWQSTAAESLRTCFCLFIKSVYTNRAEWVYFPNLSTILRLCAAPSNSVFFVCDSLAACLRARVLFAVCKRIELHRRHFIYTASVAYKHLSNECRNRVRIFSLFRFACTEKFVVDLSQLATGRYRCCSVGTSPHESSERVSISYARKQNTHMHAGPHTHTQSAFTAQTIFKSVNCILP